ncbi:MAG: PHP domain-containing protein [Burkholderiales bacterium]
MLPTKLIPIDLHCHSTNSDGAFAVKPLLELAKNNGGRFLALTDHDTVSGIAEAKEYAKLIGLNLISGVEISVTWDKNELLHIVGLNVDETNPILVANLNTLRSNRLARGEKIAHNLAKVGIKDALAGAMKYCANPLALSRTHFSRFLVEAGFAKPGKAFDKFLAPGKPGYVAQKWATLEEAVSWITQSGGIAVIAHPCRYKFTRSKLLRLIEQFKFYGGRGIEVLSSSHSKEEAENIAAIADQTGLLSSLGSDFHNLNESYRKILVGVNYPLPPLCQPIYTELGITDFN